MVKGKFIDEFSRSIQNGIKWLSSEHSYFKDLKDHLQELKRDISTGKEKEKVKEIKAAFKDFRYIGKSERRFANSEKHVEELFGELMKRMDGYLKTYKDSELILLEELKKVEKRMRIEANNLLIHTSYYEGKIRTFLFHLRDEVKDNEVEKAQQILMEVEEAVEEAEKWIDALVIDYRKAKDLATKFQYGKTVPELIEKGDSLKRLSSWKTKFDPKIIHAADEYARAGDWEHAAECYEHGGFYEEAGDANARIGQWRHAARCYINAKKWKKSGWALKKIGENKLAKLATTNPRKLAELLKKGNI